MLTRRFVGLEGLPSEAAKLKANSEMPHYPKYGTESHHPTIGSSSGETPHFMEEVHTHDRYPGTGVGPKYPGMEGTQLRGGQLDSGHIHARNINDQTYKDLLKSRPPSQQRTYAEWFKHQRTFKKLDSIKRHAAAQDKPHSKWLRFARQGPGPRRAPTLGSQSSTRTSAGSQPPARRAGKLPEHKVVVVPRTF